MADAETTEGTPAVLKLVVPRDGDARRTRSRRCDSVPARAAWRCCATTSGVVRCFWSGSGRRSTSRGSALAQRHEILCATAQLVWRPAAGAGLPSGEEKARKLAEWIVTAWEEPRSPVLLGGGRRRAGLRGPAGALAHDPARAVLVHGDVHQWNALAAGKGYKLVDPDGLEAEPEYDLGIIMREDPTELLDGDPMARRGPAGRPDRSGRGGDLGVGGRRADLDRAARHHGRPAARGRPDAGDRGPARRTAPDAAGHASGSDSACATDRRHARVGPVDTPITGQCDPRFAVVRERVRP